MKKVAVKKFFHPFGSSPARDLYQSELGWGAPDYHDAMTTNPEGILRYYLEKGYDLYLFDTITLRWYCIDNRYENRITLSKLKPNDNWDGKYLEDSQGSVDWVHFNDIPDVIFKCNTVDEFLKGAAIDGTPISDVMTRSWIEFS